MAAATLAAATALAATDEKPGEVRPRDGPQDHPYVKPRGARTEPEADGVPGNPVPWDGFVGIQRQTHCGGGGNGNGGNGNEGYYGDGYRVRGGAQLYKSPPPLTSV